MTSTLVAKSGSHLDFKQVTVADVLAVAKFASACFGKQTSLYFLIRDRTVCSLPKQITVDINQIAVQNFNGLERSYFLNKKALKLLNLLPLSFGEKRVVITR